MGMLGNIATGVMNVNDKKLRTATFLRQLQEEASRRADERIAAMEAMRAKAAIDAEAFENEAMLRQKLARDDAMYRGQSAEFAGYTPETQAALRAKGVDPYSAGYGDQMTQATAAKALIAKGTMVPMGVGPVISMLPLPDDLSEPGVKVRTVDDAKAEQAAAKEVRAYDDAFKSSAWNDLVTNNPQVAYDRVVARNFLASQAGLPLVDPDQYLGIKQGAKAEAETGLMDARTEETKVRTKYLSTRIQNDISEINRKWKETNAKINLDKGKFSETTRHNRAVEGEAARHNKAAEATAAQNAATSADRATTYKAYLEFMRGKAHEKPALSASEVKTFLKDRAKAIENDDQPTRVYIDEMLKRSGVNPDTGKSKSVAQKAASGTSQKIGEDAAWGQILAWATSNNPDLARAMKQFENVHGRSTILERDKNVREAARKAGVKL